MIAFLKGKVFKSEENNVIFESHGIGYELICSTTTTSALSTENNEIVVPTYLQVREDAMVLFGFKDAHEKNMFLKLITVSGVGPKLAITILSGISPDDLAISVLNADISTLSSVKGLGKKTAEKIVVELREKVGRIEDFGKINSNPKTVSIQLNQNIEDAAFALTALGINKNEAIKLASKFATPEMTAEDIIKKTLREMGR